MRSAGSPASTALRRAAVAEARAFREKAFELDAPALARLKDPFLIFVFYVFLY